MTVRQLLAALQAASTYDQDVRVVRADTPVVSFEVRSVKERPGGVSLEMGEIGFFNTGKVSHDTSQKDFMQRDMPRSKYIPSKGD